MAKDQSVRTHRKNSLLEEASDGDYPVVGMGAPIMASSTKNRTSSESSAGKVTPSTPDAQKPATPRQRFTST